MSERRRTTVYLESDLHSALRLKAIGADCSISDLVNGAVRRSLFLDAEDIAAFEGLAAEPTIRFGDFVKTLKRDGKL